MSTKKGTPEQAADPSRAIDQRIAEYPDWRGAVLSEVRTLILRADPTIIEEWKWNVPVWSKDGILCTGEIYRSAVKLTFAKGASVPDPDGLFTSSLEGKVRRALDLHEGDVLDAAAFTKLICAAVATNSTG